MSEVLSADEIQARIEARATGEPTATTPTAPSRFRHIRPFADAANGLIDYLTNPEGRFMFGYRDLDAMVRGFGRGELCYVTGRPHSGKTQVVVQAIANNPDKRILFFTPDEVAELILTKLVCISQGLNAEYVEERVKAKDPEVTAMVRQVATEQFSNLLVVDSSIDLSEMRVAVSEAEAYWGDRVDCIVIDFLELLPGDGDAAGVVAKSQALKRWSKDVDAPVICLHQAKRSGSTRGQGAGMDGMRYGGEAEAIFVLEVFRKRDDESLDGWDRARWQNTLTVSLVKNKRPPCKTGEVDLFIDADTGLVRTLRDEDMAVDAVLPPPPPHVQAERDRQFMADRQGEMFRESFRG